MKTIEEYVAKNKEFLPSLKRFANEAIRDIKNPSLNALIFVDDTYNVVTFIVGSNTGVWGLAPGFLGGLDLTLNDIISFPD